MKKLFLIGVGLLIILVLALFFGLSKLGPIVRTAVNTYGPKITSTDVKLDDVSISLLSGSARLKGLFLGNPEGFSSPKAVSVASVLVDIDEGTLMDDVVVIEKVEVIEPDIIYEKIKGTDNFQEILKNIKKSVGSDSASPSPDGDGKSGKKLLIKDLVVKGGTVRLTANMLGQQTIAASLPDIHLQNIGGNNTGGSPAAVFEAVLASLYGKIQSREVTAIFNKGLKELELGAKALGEGTKKGLESVADKVKGLLGN